MLTIGGAKKSANTRMGEEQKEMAGISNSDFLLRDVVESVVEPEPEFLKELKRMGWTDFAYYKSQRALTFSIARLESSEHDGNNLCRYANCVRRYINSRNENLVMDFIPNSEQTTSAKVVTESGESCLINEIRIALNGVLCRQVRGAIYELHAVNATPNQMDIMTRHITRKGDSINSAWHDDFAPTIKLGRLEPASELHIDVIYMLPGRVFTNELPQVVGGEVKMPPDHTCFLHNGFTKWAQPDMIDEKSHTQLRDPMTSSPKIIELGLYPQPFSDPVELVTRALGQLAEDFGEIATHIQKSRATFAEDPAAHYTFGNVSIAISGDQLISRIYGFDESLGVVIASNAGQLQECTHNTSHSAHPTRKETIIRITSAGPDGVLNLYARAVDLAISRTNSLVRQFGRKSG